MATKTNKTENINEQTNLAEVKPSAKTNKSIIPKEIDNEQLIVVKNGFHGRLVYKSSRTGEVYVWDSFGSEQEMELRELKSAKNTYKKFFINRPSWFLKKP